MKYIIITIFINNFDYVKYTTTKQNRCKNPAFLVFSVYLHVEVSCTNKPIE